jgi:CBS domain-containing protein
MRVETMLEKKGRHVETIAPDANLLLAVNKLTSNNIGALVVSADGAQVEGVLSERDVVRAFARRGAELVDATVASVMSRGVPVCSPDDLITAVMGQMTRTRNRHLPVVANGQLCGIVSIGDIVKNRLEEVELEANVLRDAYIARR